MVSASCSWEVVFYPQNKQPLAYIYIWVIFQKCICKLSCLELRKHFPTEVILEKRVPFVCQNTKPWFRTFCLWNSSSDAPRGHPWEMGLGPTQPGTGDYGSTVTAGWDWAVTCLTDMPWLSSTPTHTHTHTHTHHTHISIYTRTHKHTHMHTHKYIHTHTYMHIHKYTYTHMHTHMHTHKYTYMHTQQIYVHTYTQMYTHINTHTWSGSFRS